MVNGPPVVWVDVSCLGVSAITSRPNYSICLSILFSCVCFLLHYVSDTRFGVSVLSKFSKYSFVILFPFIFSYLWDVRGADNGEGRARGG
jgi:hypothetical protein